MCSSHKSTLLSQDLHSFIESPQKWDNSGYYVILQLSRRWYLNIENVNQKHEKQTLNFACNKHTNINSWIYKNIGLSILITAASLYRIYIFFSLIKKRYTSPKVHRSPMVISLHVQTPHTRYNYEIPKQPLAELQNSISNFNNLGRSESTVCIQNP